MAEEVQYITNNSKHEPREKIALELLMIVGFFLILSKLLQIGAKLREEKYDIEIPFCICT
jgi:hypothetical protein